MQNILTPGSFPLTLGPSRVVDDAACGLDAYLQDLPHTPSGIAEEIRIDERQKATTQPEEKVNERKQETGTSQAPTAHATRKRTMKRTGKDKAAAIAKKTTPVTTHKAETDEEAKAAKAKKKKEDAIAQKKNAGAEKKGEGNATNKGIGKAKGEGKREEAAKAQKKKVGAEKKASEKAATSVAKAAKAKKKRDAKAAQAAKKASAKAEKKAAAKAPKVAKPKIKCGLQFSTATSKWAASGTMFIFDNKAWQKLPSSCMKLGKSCHYPLKTCSNCVRVQVRAGKDGWWGSIKVASIGKTLFSGELKNRIVTYSVNFHSASVTPSVKKGWKTIGRHLGCFWDNSDDPQFIPSNNREREASCFGHGKGNNYDSFTSHPGPEPGTATTDGTAGCILYCAKRGFRYAGVTTGW